MHFYIFLPLFCSIFLVRISTLELTDYCSLPCDKGNHTVCMRKYNCHAVNGCMSVPPDASFRAMMVNHHNLLRTNIASGRHLGPYGNTGAKNMRSFTYDMELEFLAECWTSTCPRRHDECRRSIRFPVGQNIFHAKNINDPRSAVRFWFRGIDDLKNPKWIKKYPYSSKHPPKDIRVTYFTQVVWADTSRVGCSWAKYGPSYEESLIVCNYGPAGNVEGRPVYQMAEDQSLIASACAEGRNPHWRFLCGCFERITKEDNWAALNLSAPPARQVLRQEGVQLSSRSVKYLMVVFGIFIYLINIAEF